MSERVILVTGAAGFVGSHCLVELLTSGYQVVALDNCLNVAAEDDEDDDQIPASLRRVEQLTARSLVAFYKTDLNDSLQLEAIFAKHHFDCVIHFAALKSVAESCRAPLDYYRNNVCGTVALLEAMCKHSVKRLIFSSSCTVYGTPDCLPIDEHHPTGRNCTSPYGRSKFMVEELLKDLCTCDVDWSVTSLRYFNPVGAHESGDIGEDVPRDKSPTNLMPYIGQVALRQRPFVNIFGSDFPTTCDGTAVRDYVHIMDLVSGHMVTLDKMLDHHQENGPWTGLKVFNLGAGVGTSVLQVIQAFEQSTGLTIPYRLCDRRVGDVDTAWADIGKARTVLNWTPKWSLADMCAHSWNWLSKNPLGYRTQDSVH